VLETGLRRSGLDEWFEVVYAGEDGAEQRLPWQEMPQVVDGLSRPVRSFPSYRGQRNFPGWYWSATLGHRIGFESWVERDHLIALDFDPSVVAMVSQPFWLHWTERAGKARRHAPDFLVRLDDGQVVVLDSRPAELVEASDREAFAATDRACAQVDWRYAVWDRLDTVVVANQRWLSGYRHPRCFNEPVANLLLAAFAQPRPLIDGAAAAGDPLGTLPVLYHLLWKRWLLADLSVVLSDRTVVRLGAQPAAAPADLAAVFK
jgi:hypothetical protein